MPPNYRISLLVVALAACDRPATPHHDASPAASSSSTPLVLAAGTGGTPVTFVPRTISFDGGTAIVAAEETRDHVTVTEGRLQSESWCERSASSYDGIVSMFERFQSAVARRDKEAVADLVRFPLHVNGATKIEIADRQALLGRYDSIFTRSVCNKIKRAEPRAVFCRNLSESMLGDGVVWAEGRHGQVLVDVVNQ